MKKLILVVYVVFSLCVTHASAGEPPKRIISLAPNMTEILFALGLGDSIIGVTSFCDYPQEAKARPRVGGMSNPSLEAVVSLKPDIVVMTTDGNPKEFEERLRSLHIKTYVFEARRLSELPQGIRALGTALGVQEKAEAFARDIETALGKFQRQRHLENPNASANPVQKKKVLFVVWPEPLVVAGPGTVIDDAITLIGGENLASKAKASYPKYSLEEIFRRSPDAIFIGRGVGMEEVSQSLLQRLKNLPAVKDRKVYYVSDHLYRLGPRTLKGIEEIAGLLWR